jgi:RHS repeat-associated protein
MSYHMPYFLGSRPLFTEDFQRLNEKNSLGESGWRTKGERILGSNQLEPVLKHLSIQPAEDKRVTVVKSFNIPLDFPFDISDKNFEIRYNDDMFNDTVASDAYPRHGGHGPSANNIYSSSSTTHSNSTPGISRTSELFNTYYIYTFDGKLLAEYDHNGNCVRDYIYAGNRLIAEYKPQTSEYFYYMTDQISSTRIITNSSGNVVFSEAYGPYGDVQKTWTNTYIPKMKFSGKEREGYSDLDYFGARYHDHKSYRFNSVDPVISKAEALINPQLWNLYAYCNNNPITYYDPDGRLILVVPWLLNPATIAAITAAATAGAIATHNLVKSIDVDEVVEDVIEADIVVVKTGLDILSSGLLWPSTKISEMSKKDDAKSGGASSKGKEFKRSISGESAKQAAKDAPSWAKGKRPYKGESGKDFAKRLLDEKYGKGNWDKGSNTEHNKIKKYGDRAFE